MKTFTFDSLERYSRFSDFRNIKKLICNKPWRAFTEDAEQETYTFMPNGNVMIAYQGKSLKGAWAYDAKAKSITLSSKSQDHRFSIVFFDTAMMAMRIDGDTKFAFLVNTSNDKFFQPQRYTDIIGYFRNMEEAEDKDVASAAINPDAITSHRSPEFQQKVEQIRTERRLQDEAEELRQQLTKDNRRYGKTVVVTIVIIVYVIYFTLNYFTKGMSFGEAIIDALTYGTIINVVVCLLCINILVEKLLNLLCIRTWKRMHTNDLRNKHL